MTSEPPAKKAAKKASKKEQETLSKAAASPTVRKTRTRKTVTAKVEPPTVSQQEVDQWERDDEQVELTAEVQSVVDAVDSQLDQLIGQARALGLPALRGTSTVSLHFEFDDASDPIEAVQMAINAIVLDGLVRLTWVVRDEATQQLYGVANGRVVDLEAARVGP